MTQSVAVVGEDAGVAETVRREGGVVVDPTEADALVAVGEGAIIDTGVGDTDVPVLPVTPGGSRHTVPTSAVADAVRALLDGAVCPVDHPVLAVDVDGDRAGRAVFDATLLTAETARISEYAVETGGERLDSFRADAVVVATPLGSDGYAQAAGGPVLQADTGLVVAPVAPFTTHTSTWVVPGTVHLSVARDDEPVSLVLDDGEWGEVPPHSPVVVDVADTVTLLRIPGAGHAGTE